jgi:HAD superfamily hydrolase (TIGR01509 family)
MGFEAILWDCDGCLIDSEHIACGLYARLLSSAGYAITTEDFILRFCGQSKNHIFSTILQDSGMDYRQHIDAPDKKDLLRLAFEQNLKPITDIQGTLDQLFVPMAIASGSEYERLNHSLKVAKLYDRFFPHIYSSSSVSRGKPQPDIFLYAANKLGVTAHNCLVIEDSHNGVRAGKAAGMTVFGFTGGSHILDKKVHADDLYKLGADHVFHHMTDLPKLILAH